MKKIILILGVLLISLSIQAQVKKMPKELTKEIALDAKIHPSGFALGGYFGMIRNEKHTLMAHFQITSLRHHREVKQRNDFPPGPFNNSPKPYVYGKRNSFYGTHLGFGGKYYFSEKARRRAVAVAVTYSAGPSIGFLKPYYLNIVRQVDGGNDFFISAESYSIDNHAEFINPGIIFGGAGFSKGFGELKVIAGGYLQSGINIDWGANHNFLKSIELGVMIDAYAKTVPIMIPDVKDNKFLFVNLYLAIQLGKRY